MVFHAPIECHCLFLRVIHCFLSSSFPYHHMRTKRRTISTTTSLLQRSDQPPSFTVTTQQWFTQTVLSRLSNHFRQLQRTQCFCTCNTLPQKNKQLCCQKRIPSFFESRGVGGACIARGTKPLLGGGEGCLENAHSSLTRLRTVHAIAITLPFLNTATKGICLIKTCTGRWKHRKNTLIGLPTRPAVHTPGTWCVR